ncbi:MAG: glycosyltransferase family 4 protein [Anaerolinea sp.]|nr:glycosyltransferase family 4 protein [Anaerolinea sp.]
MRIAHVTATFPPYRGGTGNVCFYNARELARRGHQVTVFTAAAEGAPDQERIEGFQVQRLRPWLRVGNAPLLPQLTTALHGYDIIHLHLPFIAGGELSSLGAALRQTPLVVTYHSDLINDGSWRDLVFRAAMWSSRHAVMMRADAVLFVSQGHAETCAQHVVYDRMRQRCHILPNGVDTELFRPGTDGAATRQRLGLEAERPVVGFVGVLDRAHHYKGLAVLMAALSEPACSEVQLLIVGDGELKEEYSQRATQHSLNERTVFFGRASHGELAALLRACDLLSVPSLAPESFGMVIVEAFSCGVPVVASDGPGVRSLVESGIDGFLTPSGDAAALAERVQVLLTLPTAQRQAMGQAGRRKVEQHYAWPQIGARLEEIYRQCLA